MSRVLLLGSTGTIGRAVARALRARGHEVVAYGRRSPDLAGVTARIGPAQAIASQLRGERFDAVVSCLASRTGAPADAWAIDHDANLAALQVEAVRFVLLSAICVQKPRLAFQRAKLAFEQKLAASGRDYVIVRPTAFFKSLSGQVQRVKAGKPFLMFGDGRLTSCKPIGDDDLAGFLVDCLDGAGRRILPIGGPGPAITPWDQAEALFGLLKRPMKVRRVPLAMLDAIILGLDAAGAISIRLKDKAEFARIGRYYATESMLVWDDAAQSYDAAATPETGEATLFEHYARLLRGDAEVDLREHAAF